jgi:hypothetical protein
VALSLFFLGCERDEVQEPNNSQTLSQQEAMNLFLKSYQSKEDAFRDEVVNRLLAMNDSTGVIFELVRKYGQPRWELEKTTNRKSGNLLFIPINAIDVDSISAIFAFVDSAGHTYLKIYEAQSPDTLVSDFVLFYQCGIYPYSGLKARMALPHGEKTKSFVTEERCWDVYTTTNGGATYTYSYSFCKSSIVQISLRSDGSGSGSGYTGNEIRIGGGGGTSGSGTTSPNTTTLSTTAKNNLKNAETKLKDGPCLSKTIMNSTWNSSLTIRIGTVNGGDALYNRQTGILTFSSTNAITDQNLLHELLHAYQTNLYGSSYEITMTHEFEAWLLVDLYLIRQGNLEDQLTWTRDYSPTVQKAYFDWLNSMLTLGRVECQVGVNNHCEIFRDALASRNSRYSNYKPGDGKLNTINNLLGKCK